MHITQENALSPPPSAGGAGWGRRMGRSLRREWAEPQRAGGRGLVSGSYPKNWWEYIQLNFTETGDAPSLPPRLPPPSRDGADVEVRSVCLSKQGGRRGPAGAQLREHPHLRGPRGPAGRGAAGAGRRAPGGPCWRWGASGSRRCGKRSPAALCGEIKLRDELLSLNGQLMVGVDVSGAR